jgi:hypothetical protein
MVGFNDYDKEDRPAYADVHISFKLPDTEVPKAFEARLRESGLKAGEFKFGDDEEEVPTNLWWIYCLYTMPNEDKYWEAAEEED